MKKITLHYKKVIDINARSDWERMVWEDSYSEFRMQFQNFNQADNLYTYAALKNKEKDTKQLSFLVSAGIIVYIQQLNSIAPDLIDNVGEKYFHFDSFRFEIIGSDIRNKNQHKIALNFYSQPLEWLDTIAEYLLVNRMFDNEEKVLHTIKIVPYLSIQTLEND